MAEHPAVAFLQAAHARAEQLARATTVHQPYDEWTPVGVDRDDDTARSCWEVALIARPAVRSPAARALMEHMALHDPAAVLCRVAAERQILARHEPWRAAGVVRCRDDGLIHDLWPCPTVLLLAEAWGWTAET